MIKILISVLSVSFAAQASTILLCESEFSALRQGDSRDHLSAHPDILNFPNVVDSRVMPIGDVGNEKGNLPKTDVDSAFQVGLNRATQTYSVLRPQQILPLTLKQLGERLYIHCTYGWTSLIGHFVVGYRTTRVERIGNYQPGFTLNANVDRLYFAGEVISAGLVDGRLRMTIKTSAGAEVNLDYPSDEPSEPFLVLTPRKSPAEVLREAFRRTNVEGLVAESFGSPTAKEDYDIASAVVETALSVPLSYGPSAVIKIILGRTIKGGEAYAHYGLARGKKRYSEKSLTLFVASIYAFMESSEVLNIKPREGGGPEWLSNFNKTPLADEFVTIWREIREAKGGAEKVIVAKKPRAAGNMKLTREVATVGVRIIVKSDSEGLMIGDDFGQSRRLTAVPGQELVIVKAPRTVRKDDVGISLIRLRDPISGVEGETFWTSAIKAALLKDEPNK